MDANKHELKGIDLAPSETEVKALRDAVYGPGSEKNWAGCREYWMRPESVRWLREQSGR